MKETQLEGDPSRFNFFRQNFESGKVEALCASQLRQRVKVAAGMRPAGVS